VVCGPCSLKKFLLPTQSSKPLRVCDHCYDSLIKTDDKAANMSFPGKAPLFQRPLSTVVEVAAELEAQEIQKRPPRPPLPRLFPEPSPGLGLPDSLPEAAEDAPDVQLPVRNPQLYKLVQMSTDTNSSFDLDDGDDQALVQQENQRPRGFMRQTSSSFWWDANDDMDDDILADAADPYPSTISTTIYKEHGIFAV
jgi:hypothetical protein